MNRIITNFNKLYPAFAAKLVSGSDVVIFEHENIGKPNTFQKLTVKNVTGWNFSRDFLENTKSFHSKAQNGVTADLECHDIMTRECDGLFCREEGDDIVFHFFELKSSFEVDNLSKAKNQIVGSYLKMLHLLAPLQHFGSKNITMQGHIIIYEPTPEKLSTFKDLTDHKSRFCLRIHNDKRCHMPADKCSRFWHPLTCPDIFLNLTELPFGTISHQITL